MASSTKKLPSILANIFLFFCSLSIALIVAELSIRYFYPQNLSGTWLYETPSGLIVNKTSGSARHQLNDTRAEYHFGKFHNRIVEGGHDEFDKKRILVLGDSYAFGWLLNDNNTFVNKLQKNLSEFTLINSSTGGWGTADYAKYIEQFCTVVNPSEILIFLNVDDVGRALKSKLFIFRNGELQEGSVVMPSRMKSLLNSLPFYNWLISHSHLLSLMRSIYIGQNNSVQNTFYAASTSPPVPTTLLVEKSDKYYANQLAYKLFLKIKSDSALCGAKLKIIYTGWTSLDDVSEKNNPTILFLKSAKEDTFFEKNNIDFFDLSNTKWMIEVQESRQRFTIPLDGHPNNLGAEYIYQATMDKLKGNSKN